ncbi:MAG: hypothetical protein II889_13785 [Clostridia bacterium]|nr:hypothetical protein [Clostridia bacterium]
MASRILHLAVSALLEKAYVFRDPDRLHVGCVMPDACTSRDGHFRVKLADGRRTYALSRFRERYGDRMRSDDLYLGYYLHLAEDMIHRQILYGEHHYVPTEDYVRRLHRDYSLLNPLIISQYGLRDDVRLPDGWEDEPIAREFSFRLPEFLDEMRGDFSIPPNDGPYAVFTPEIADEFIRRAAEAMAGEIEAMRRGETTMDEIALAWG